MTIVPASDEWMHEQEQNMLRRPTAKPKVRKKHKYLEANFWHPDNKKEYKTITKKELKEAGLTDLPWEPGFKGRTSIKAQ